MINNKHVVIVILNWNGWEDTIECLESVYQINYPKYDVILIDNDSKDNSIKMIKKYCEGKLEVHTNFFSKNKINKPIKIIEDHDELNLKNSTKLFLIRNNKNKGFSGGNNIGINFALEKLNPEYILLLNNDTVVDENFLCNLVKTAESNKNTGIVGPKICYYDHPHETWSSDCKISWLTGNLSNQNSKKVNKADWVSGCCIILKRELIKKIGLLDSELFFGWEDVDYCIRSKKVGFDVYYNPKSLIWHKISKSRKKLYKNIFSSHYNRYKNRFIFLKVLMKYSTNFQKIFQMTSFLFLYTPFIWIAVPIQIFIKHTYYLINKFLIRIVNKIE